MKKNSLFVFGIVVGWLIPVSSMAQQGGGPPGGPPGGGNTSNLEGRVADLEAQVENLITLGGLACVDNQVAKWDGTNQQWECASDQDTTDTEWTHLQNVPSGLNDGDDDRLGELGGNCGEGEVPKWINSDWVCQADDDTVYTDDDTLDVICVSLGAVVGCDPANVLSSLVQTYSIGETGPGGGIVFYTYGGGRHGLEAAYSTIGTAPWGCEGTDITTFSEIGTGADNTATIVTDCAQDGIAAKLADNFVNGEADDWFLPSEHEARLLLHSQVDPPGSNGFVWCWTSTQEDADYAVFNQCYRAPCLDSICWVLDQHLKLKSAADEAGVRPIRQF